MQENNILTSSTGQGLSLTIKGALVLFIPLTILIARHFHLEITETVLINYIDAFTIALGGLAVIFGLIRKAYYKYKNK